MENSLIAEFENLKISALSKSKIINSHIHNVTIGPNSKILEDSTNVTPKKVHRELDAAKEQHKSHSVRLKRSPLGKMLVEIEAQRKDEVQSAVRARIEKMQSTIKQLESHSKTEWVKKQQVLIEQSNKQEELMMKTLEDLDKKARDYQQLRQIKLQQQAEERIKRNLEQQFKEKQRHQLLLVIEAIQKQQHAFRVIYQEIFLCLKDSNVATRGYDSVIFTAISEASVKLKMLSENMEKLKEKCKAGTVTTSDFEMSIALVREAGRLKESFQTIIAAKLEEDRQKLELAKSLVQQDVKSSPSSDAPASTLAQPSLAQATPAQTTSAPAQPVLKIPTPAFPVTPAPEPVPTPIVTSSQQDQPPTALTEPDLKNSLASVETFVSRSALKMYSSLQLYLETYTSNYAQLASDPRLKQFRFHCQKAVNIPLNAISGVSQQHLLDKYQRLSNLLKGLPVEAGGTNVLSSQHPQGIAYCTDLLAKKFVLQGDLLISSNPESAYCYAAMIVALWHEFPDFGKLVLAYFYQTVPYLVPIYPPQIQGQTDQDYYRSLGYLYGDGVIEKQDKFLKRMSGIVRLYAAITVSSLKRNQRGEHPHGLVYAWRWIANILNLEPRPDITATVLFEFLEVTGSSMLAAYGVQFQKILNYIHNVHLPLMLKTDSGGPVCRLEVLIQKIKSTGHIEPPKGKLPEGFW